MLYLDPDLVQAERAKALPPRLVNIRWESLTGNFSWKDRSATDGYAGSPSVATPEISQKILATAGKFCADEIQSILPLGIRLFLKMIDLDDL